MAIQRERVIIDPSALLTKDALSWLRDKSIRPYLTVAAGVAERLRAQDPFRELHDLLVIPVGSDVIQALRAEILGIEAFHQPLDKVSSDGIRQIAEALLDDGPLGDILADEWIFLTSNSLGIFRDKAEAIRWFKQKATYVYEAATEDWQRAILKVRDRIPPGLLEPVKDVANWPRGQGGQWLLAAGGVVAGQIVSHLAPPVGIAVDVALLVKQGTAIVVGDP